MKKTKDAMIAIPFHMAKLLAAEPEDFKDPAQYGDVQAATRGMLRVLLALKK